MSLVFLISAWSLFYHRIILGLNFLWEDFPFAYFTLKTTILERLLLGQIPLWDPNVFAGHPIIADPSTGIFYPLNILLVPLINAGNLEWNFWLLEMFTIGHILLGGIFMYLLIRSLKLSKYAGIIAGLAFMFASFWVVQLKHVAMVLSGVWLPLIFLVYYKFLKFKKTKHFLLSALLLGVSFLGGHYQIVYYIILFLFLYTLFFVANQIDIKIISLSVLKKFKPLIWLGGLVLLAAMIGSVQLLPAFEFLSLAKQSAADINYSLSFSLNPIQFMIGSLLPFSFGGYGELVPYLGEWNFWEMASYTGIITLLLATMAIAYNLKKKAARPEENYKQEITILSLVAFTALLLSFGRHLVLADVLFPIIPGMKFFRVPARLILVFQFATIILAAFGFDYITKFFRDERLVKIFRKVKNFFLKIILPTSTILVISSLILLFEKETNYLEQIFYNNLVSLLILIFVPLALFLGFNKYKKNGKIKTFFWIIAVFLTFDLFIFGFRFNLGSVSPTHFYPNSEELNFVKNNLEDGERFSPNGYYLSNTGQLLKIPSVDGYSFWVTKRYEQFTNGNFGKAFGKNEIDSSNRANLLGIKYAFKGEADFYKPVEGEENISFNPNVLPKAFLVPRAEVVNNPNQILKEIDQESFDPHQVVYIEKKSSQSLDSTEILDPEKNSVVLLERLPEKITLESKTEKPAMLFLSESFYPGWQAYVDGKKVEIFQANYLFQTIELPAGEHKIIFKFIPMSFYFGALISGATTLILLGLLLRQIILHKKD